MRFLVVSALLLSAGSAFAQTGDRDEVVYRKHTVVDFGDDTLEGSLNKPDTLHMMSATRRPHYRLINVRLSFKSEIIQMGAP